MSGKQDKFSFPGLAKSIVRPVVRTTTTAVKRGEKVVGNVAGLAISTVNNTVSGTGKVANGLARGSVKIVRDAAGVKRTRKSTGKKSLKK